jgi:hypothetical protein
MQRKFIASNQTRGYRVVSNLVVNQDNQQAQIDLPRGPHIESCIVRVGGTINVTTAFAGGVRSIAPYRFLRRLEWLLNSNVTLDSVSGTQLAQTYVTRRKAPPTTVPAAALGPQSFEATFFLDRALLDMMRPKDSLLKTDVGVSNNQLKLQFGTLADMFGNGAGAATYTNVQAEVAVIDYQEQRDAAGNTPAPAYYVKRNGLSQSISAAGTGQQIKLNTGNRLRMVSMRVLNATTLEPDLTLLQRVRVQRAGDTRVDLPVSSLARINASAYGVDLLPGQVLIDFANIGALGVRYSEFWPIPSSADTFLLVDTSGPCVLEISTIEGVDLVGR